MNKLLLKTKFNIPQPRYRSRIIARPRLLDAMEAGTKSNLGIISAPAGYGKTTLVRQWIDTLPWRTDETNDSGTKRGVVWLSLDKGDNELSLFMAYFIAALQQVVPQVGHSGSEVFEATQFPQTEIVFTHLINDIVISASDFWMVLEDYHVIDDESIHEALAFLLNNQPPQMHLIITSRTMPPLPLARLRSQNRLFELGVDDLRFTLDESTTYLNHAMGLKLSTQDIRFLESRNEGWATGLQLMAISFRKNSDIQDYIKLLGVTNHYITEYLLEEVMSHQAEHIRSFLLRTSILEHMSASLCNDVAEVHNSQTILESLESKNLFVVTIDSAYRWFRYHPLFKDFLYSILERQFPDHIPELHRRAMLWHEKNGSVIKALEHAFACEGYDHAARIIEKHFENLWPNYGVGLLRGLLIRLPHETIVSNPRLALYWAWLEVLLGHLTEVESYLEIVEDDIRSIPQTTESKAVQGMLYTIQAISARMQGEIDKSIELCLRSLSNIPAELIHWQNVTNITLGIAYYMKGEMRKSNNVLEGVVSTSINTGNMLTALVSGAQLAQLYIDQGHLVKAENLCKEVLLLASQQDQAKMPLASRIHICLSSIYYEWNNTESFSEHLDKAVSLCNVIDNYRDRIECLLLESKRRYIQGSFCEALQLLEDAEEVVRKRKIYEFSATISACKARISIAQRDLCTAATWAKERQLDLDVQFDNLDKEKLEEYITFARLLIAQGKSDEAQVLLRTLDNLAEVSSMNGWRIRILVLLALSTGDSDQAVDALCESLSLSHDDRFVQVFIDEGDAIRRLLEIISESQQRMEENACHNYATTILAQWPRNESIVLSEDSSDPTTKLDGLLTDRELEVIHLISTGHSRQQIAEKLTLASSTIDTHVKHIYIKLNVNNRVQAAVRAKELGLLSDSS